MTKMNVHQVKEARRRATSGESVPSIAADMGLTYAPVWCAIRGITWSSICNPPPLASLPKGVRPSSRSCRNCGQLCHRKSGGRIKGRCRRCHMYHYRHGRERPPGRLNRKTVPVDTDKAIRLYNGGKSLREVGALLRIDPQTLRRRLHESGVAIRPCSRHALDCESVTQARHLVYREGWPVSRVADELHPDVSYQTLYSAVTGQTWRNAPGPRPCATCRETITIHPSGYCWNCRPENTINR